MPIAGNRYVVEVKPSHIDWGEYRNPTNRQPIEGESYVKIPSRFARAYNIRRGSRFTAYFDNGFPPMEIKASGNGPYMGNVQFAKQFEGIGRGACKAFTPWYRACGIGVGDKVEVEFLSPNEVKFKKV